MPRCGELAMRVNAPPSCRVDEEGQVRDRVLDLRPLVELRAADHLVADLRAHEHVLEHPRLRVRPVEDGDLGPRDALVDEPLDLRGDVARLGVLVGQLAHLDRVALADVGPQRLGLPPAVVGHDRVGRAEDRLRRAVVLLELHDVRVGIVVLEVEDVADVGAAEAVDRVVGDQAVGDEVVRRLHVEVVHGRVEGDALDGLDDVVAAVVARTSPCPAARSPRRMNGRLLPAPRVRRAQARDSSQMNGQDLAIRPTTAIAAPKSLKHDSYRQLARSRLRRPHGQADAFERGGGASIAPADRNDVHRRPPAAVAAERHRDVSATALEGARHMVRPVEAEVRVEQQVAPWAS